MKEAKLRSKSVLISLPKALLDQADELAKSESRSRSDFFREVIRAEILKREWDRITKYGRAQAKKSGYTEKDVVRLVKEVREEIKKERLAAENEGRS